MVVVPFDGAGTSLIFHLTPRGRIDVVKIQLTSVNAKSGPPRRPRGWSRPLIFDRKGSSTLKMVITPYSRILCKCRSFRIKTLQSYPHGNRRQERLFRTKLHGIKTLLLTHYRSRLCKEFLAKVMIPIDRGWGRGPEAQAENDPSVECQRLASLQGEVSWPFSPSRRESWPSSFALLCLGLPSTLGWSLRIRGTGLQSGPERSRARSVRRQRTLDGKDRRPPFR
jgi:hypothetical protein